MRLSGPRAERAKRSQRRIAQARRPEAETLRVCVVRACRVPGLRARRGAYCNLLVYLVRSAAAGGGLVPGPGPVPVTPVPVGGAGACRCRQCPWISLIIYIYIYAEYHCQITAYSILVVVSTRVCVVRDTL